MSRLTSKDELARFERRCKAALVGKHLPSVDDLLRLGPFYMNSLEEDIKAFAARLETALKHDCPEANELRNLLRALSIAPWSEVVRSVMNALADLPEGIIRNRSRDEYERRLQIYAAYLGDMADMRKVSEICFEKASLDRNNMYRNELIRAFLGWQTALLHRSVRTGLRDWSLPRERLHEYGASVIQTIVSNYSDTKPLAQKAPKAEKPAEETETEDNPNDGVVVVRVVGNAIQNATVVKEFSTVLGERLPLMEPPDLRAVRNSMSAEFPYALRIIDTLLDEVALHKHVRIRPTVLVGEPGVGKTRFWEKLLGLLDIPFTVYSCGGVSDSSLAGTARRWSSGEPSLPLSLVRQHHIANPAIVLDEIEKAGTSRHNGNLLDALLAFMEKQSATNYYDPYLQAPVDLSAVVWCATANTAQGWPKPLRDRVRILRFTTPEPEHLEPLARMLMSEIAIERGQHEKWWRPLTGLEIDALQAVWSGGSVRQLRRYLEGVLAARESAMEKH
jgi:hypothetical protein